MFPWDQSDLEVQHLETSQATQLNLMVLSSSHVIVIHIWHSNFNSILKFEM